ncbi:MAG TPA: cupin domain-containing protein [Gammaproteobacteria bacterium]|nr:cupin domain-containing protein [Gammaproteobacteria bacterium]
MTVQQDKPLLLVDTADVRVAEFSLPAGQAGECHYHSNVSEHCYCLEGILSVTLESSPCKTLSQGERLLIPPGVPHQVANTGGVPSRYLVVQGVGVFDFIRLTGECDAWYKF